MSAFTFGNFKSIDCDNKICVRNANLYSYALHSFLKIDEW